MVGTYMCISGALAGASALLSQRLILWSGGPATAIYRIHFIAALVTSFACVGFFYDHKLLGLVLMLGLASLQNIRRPIFVAQLDNVMPPSYRATTLSVESQSRSWAYAAASVGLGWIADVYGLFGVFGSLAVLFWLACLFSRVRRPQNTPMPL